MERGIRPGTLQQALHMRPGTIPIAGGTDLMVRFKSAQGTLPTNDRPFLFIAHLPELQGIRDNGDSISIGAAIPLNTLADSEMVPDDLKMAIRRMAAPNLRNIATIGGNIMNASPAGDTLPILIARDSRAVLMSEKGKREMPITELVNGPCTTCITHEEILTEVIIPKKDFNHIKYRKLGTRKAMSLSKISMLILADIVNGTIRDIRIAFGAVAPVVVRSLEAEKYIIGKKLAELDIDSIVVRYDPLIRPITDQRSTANYRKITTLRMLRHGLENL